MSEAKRNFLCLFSAFAPFFGLACGDSETQMLRPDRGFRRPVDPALDAGEVSAHPCGLRATSSLEVRLEIYENEADWTQRLQACVRRVSFDDVVAAAGPVEIEADRYGEAGVILTAPNQGGQFVHPNFGLPLDFQPVSEPNVFAPGPRNGPMDQGGYLTVATFVESGAPAMVAGFGAYFLDTDYPDIKLSGLTALDGQRRALGPFADVSGPSGSRLFLGVVSVLQGVPVAAIHSVEIETGDGWVEAADINEVVALDDVVFGVPAVP